MLDIAAILVALLCVALAWASRGNLNVDGVSYLDLADRLKAGDLAGFVQGYWSPVYPVLLALVTALTGTSGSDAVMAAHAINLATALLTVLLIWRAARRERQPWLGVWTLTAYLFASARTVRIDAVTPDLLLMLALVGFGIELLRREGWRGTRLGGWAGIAFLAKTSIWPWLFLGSALSVVVLRHNRMRRHQALQGIAVAAVPVVIWVAAMSLDARRLTIGDTGRLGACWYLWSCDGRTPDTHRGTHDDYHMWVIGAGRTAQVATFSDTGWTYAPWSDPGAWQQRLTSQQRQSPTILDLVQYTGKQAGLVVGLWMALLLVVVLLPTLLTTRGAPPPRTLLRTPAGLLLLLGVLGILQFVAVHAEPRLIAPFVMLFAMGWLDWRARGTHRTPHGPAALAALTIALGIGGWHLLDQSLVTASALARSAQLEAAHPPGSAPHRVAIIGPTLPMMPDLYRARAHAVAQVMSPDPATILAWPPEAQAVLLGRLASLGARTVWISRGRDAYRIIPLEPPAASGER